MVLLSRYVRPVHEDVVLYWPRAAGPESSRAPVLGRVLAKPGDRLEARQGSLVVNGMGLDLDRADQRFALEQAGRSEKLRRGLSTVLHPLSGGAPVPPGCGPGACLRWDEGDWGPAVLPQGLYLVLPDEESIAPRASYVPRADILGRVIGPVFH